MTGTRIAAFAIIALLLFGCGSSHQEEQAALLRQAQAMCQDKGGVARVNFDDEDLRLDEVECREAR